MSVDTIITSGTVVTESQMFDADVAIDDGRIAGVGDRSTLPEGEAVVEADRKLVMPSFVDPHVPIGRHVRDGDRGGGARRGHYRD